MSESLGEFIGELILKPLPDGRRMQLVNPYAFKRPAGDTWRVPKKAIVDGASIPRPFWSVIGGPFEGRYRNASVIHDYYCDRRSKPWEQVHKVFYDGMLAAGVERRIAKLMYGAVYFGGPRWSDTVVHNAALSGARKRRATDLADGLDDAPTFGMARPPVAPEPPEPLATKPEILPAPKDFTPDELMSQLDEDLSLEEIERRADALRSEKGGAIAGKLDARTQQLTLQWKPGR
ncbi:MAG TPA: DUF1353 domain-containing protein [Phenylobacterium sp.]